MQIFYSFLISRDWSKSVRKFNFFRDVRGISIRSGNPYHISETGEFQEQKHFVRKIEHCVHNIKYFVHFIKYFVRIIKLSKVLRSYEHFVRIYEQNVM